MTSKSSVFRFGAILSLLTFGLFAGNAQAWQPDNGDGTFKNPVLYADYADPDIIRVGNDFYMVSTTFVDSPGITVLHSKDMVNWEITSHCATNLDGGNAYNLIGGTAYQSGFWASSIRYYNGTFYVVANPTFANSRIYYATSAAGPWQYYQLNQVTYDPGLFIDSNGAGYIVAGHGPQSVFVLNSTFSQIVTVSNNVVNSGGEGSHVVKRGSYYYLFNANPGVWPYQLRCSRATNIFGPWETGHICLTATTGGHQGSIVDINDSDQWFGFVHQDSGSIGRMPRIGPVFWENNWPVFGTVAARDQIATSYTKPVAGQPLMQPATSDDFSNSSLGLQWQWNHNPDNTRWSLTERPGYLRLRPTYATNFWVARNTLTQKGQGPTSYGIVKLDLSGLQSGDVAGFGTLGKVCGNIAVTVGAGGVKTLRTTMIKDTVGSYAWDTGVTIAGNTLYLRTDLNFTNNLGICSYSTDGTTWTPLGGNFELMWGYGSTFQGEKFAVFCYNTNTASSVGYVDVDSFTFGETAPLVTTQRGRPHINAAHSTFVGDNGQPLRGPYTSTEWTTATSSQNIANMKNLGFNAVHLYAESFDPNYPASGSTAPGYHLAEVDKIVAETRTNGLYLVMTIGNGAYNGDHNTAWATNFWNIYAARYANETHVLFEIHNEPMAWGPSYLTGTSPAGTMDMEIAAYRAIRAVAPDSPVLLFSYAVLGGSGGSDAALTDIHAFNQTIFGTQNAVWTNIAVGFHGYAGASGTAVAVGNLINAGYPCLMTEFGDGTWGGGNGGLDVEGVANWERLGVSWLTFAYVPPSGVSDDVTRPDAYVNRVVNSGLSWMPDYGSFPVVRSVYGNGGYPWTTSGYNNNALGGTLRIEAENFDNGGKNVAYYNANSANPGGQYRTGETVGIEATADTGGGYDVGWNAAGNWLEYTMKISVAGTYNLRLRVAGASAGSVQVLAYGNNRNQTTNGVDLTGQWTLPNTGGNQAWQTVTKSVFLAPGQQRLRINVLAGGFNLNWIELTPATAGPIANGTYKFLNAASAQALDLDANNNVVTATSSTSNKQQWNLRHIGGGNYQVSPASGGNSWDAGTPLHLSPWGWAASGSSCFFMEPTAGGFYRFFSAGSGTSFAASTSTNTLTSDIYTGAAAQQWAIVAPTVPAFPIGLSATAVSATQISLTWNAVAGATSYNVKRATTSGGSYTTIASGVTTTNFTDIVSVGTPYYYVVSAVVGGVESFNSVEVTVAVPFPWQTQDVGSVGAAGNAAYTYSNGVFSVAGSGSDIWGSSDAFRFVYVPVTGNCTVVVRVVSLQNVDGWSKAGVMIRESLAANAANAFIAVTPGNGVTWQTRSSTGANTGNSATSGLSAPYWVKLVRSGNTFTGYRSADGTNWTQQGSASFTMASAAYIGLAVTSHNNSSLCTAVFDNMTAPNWPPPTAPTGLIALAASATQVNLGWNAFADATSYNVKRATTSGGPYTVIAAGVTTTSFADVGLVAGVKYYYVISAMAGGAETPDSAEASVAGQWAWLKFDESGGVSASDSTGNGRNGTLINSPVRVAGKFGNAVDLNGASQYVTLPSGVVNGLTTCTLAAWVNLDAASTWSRVFDFGSGTATNMFLTVNNGSVVRFALKAGGGEQIIDGLSPLPTNVWTHVAVTLNGSTGILYVNGVEAGRNSSLTLTPSSMGGTTQNYLGKSQYSDPYLDGRVDDFRIYSEALGAAEVAALAAQQAVAAPAAPVGLAATSVPGEVNLVWNTVTNAISYNLKYSTTNGGPYAVIATGITATNFLHTGLNPGTNYYMVSAVNLGGESSYSAPVSVTTLPAASAAPTGLMATVVSTLQINLSWTASAGAESYIVKRSTTNGGDYTIVASGITATNYADTSLTGGTMYYYVVSAVNSGGESTNSVQAAAATLSPTQGSMVHRYSFSESGGSTVADSVGGPVWNGTLPNGGTLAGGQLALSSSSLQYATLPAGIVNSMSNVTVMAWVNLASVTYWSRLFDFGNDATSYLYVTPRNGFDYTARFAISTSGAGGEQKINGASAVNPSAWHQVAVSLNAGIGILYVDGEAIGTNSSLSINPSSLGSTTHNYLGRSQSGSEPYYDGLLDEFRIYNAGLSAAEIAATVALGPDELLSTNRPAISLAPAGTDLMLSWPLANAGYSLQSCTNLDSGDWQPVTSPAPQIVGANWQITLPPTNTGSVFFRLSK